MNNRWSKFRTNPIVSLKDIIIILLFLLVALLFLVFQSRSSGSGATCEILYQREIVMNVSLDKEQTFSIEQLPNVVLEVRDGRIAFIQSDCPDKTCVRTGFISEHGQFAACLPNGIALRIVADHNEDTPDTIAQ